MGFFAVLHKLGIIGIMIYFFLFRRIYIASKTVFKHSKNYVVVLGAIYLFMISFDSLISFSHMMSNFMFWILFFIVDKEARNIKIREI